MSFDTVSPSGDPTDWELRSPILEGVGTNQELERPHVVVQDGRYYLFLSSHEHTFAEGLEGYDALYGFVKLLELLSRAKTTLHDLAQEIPSFFMVRLSVNCPWELKGTVMRVMTRECRDDGKVELIDGIKIYQNGRWALILPDASEPVFHLYAEAESPEAAQNLLERYHQRIEGMKGSPDG